MNENTEQSKSKYWFIPTGNKSSLVAYYCGVFAFIPLLGYIIAPIALAFGIIGLMHYFKNNESRGLVHSLVGLISGLIFTILHYGITLWIIIAVTAD